MTTPVARTARDDAQNVAQEAKGQAQNVAQEAAGQAQNVAQEAKGQAQNVAVEAKHQARDLAGEARSELRSQADTQRDRVVETLRELGQELREMADGGNHSGIASTLARQASDQVQSVSGYLEGRGPGDLVDDLRSFARRRPGMFLLGAAAAGVLAGRATRGVKAAASDSSSGSSGSYGPSFHESRPMVGTSTSDYPYTGSGYTPAATTGATAPVTADAPATGPAYSTPPTPGSTGTAAGRPVEGLDAAETRYEAATDPAFGLEPDPAERRLP